MANILLDVINSIILFISILISVAYFTLLERKVMGSMQRRQGPSIVGIYGILQPIVDGIKLILKETIVPSTANFIIFILSPIITFVLNFLGWAVIPFAFNIVFVDLTSGILFIFAISSLSVYGIIMSGWSSNSKYAFLGSLRSAAQMISYEISIGLIILTVIAFNGSLNLTDIVEAQKTIWYIFPLFPSFIMFLISMLAETNRHPFDLPEAESELVSGYNVEYSSMTFALFFLGEYSSMLLMSSLVVILFLGGWHFPIITSLLIDQQLLAMLEIIIFSIKTSLFAFFFVWVRATLPRYRYDQLMYLGWKILLPISFGYLVFICGILIIFRYGDRKSVV